MQFVKLVKSWFTTLLVLVPNSDIWIWNVAGRTSSTLARVGVLAQGRTSFCARFVIVESRLPSEVQAFKGEKGVSYWSRHFGEDHAIILVNT